MVVTVLAALVPAVGASRVPPVAAMREAAALDRPLNRLTVAGVLVLGAGAAALTVGLARPAMVAVLAGVLACLIAAALLAPSLTRPAAGVLGRVFSWSMPGRLGRLNSARNPRRTAATASALMIGVALVTGVTVIVHSVQASLSAWAEDTLRADLVITGEPAGNRPPSFDAGELERAGELAGVHAAAGVYADRAVVDGDPDYVNATTDLAALADIYGAEPASGELTTLSAGEVAVSQSVATGRGLRVGDTVMLRFGRGDPPAIRSARTDVLAAIAYE